MIIIFLRAPRKYANRKYIMESSIHNEWAVHISGGMIAS